MDQKRILFILVGILALVAVWRFWPSNEALTLSDLHPLPTGVESKFSLKADLIHSRVEPFRQGSTNPFKVPFYLLNVAPEMDAFAEEEEPVVDKRPNYVLLGVIGDVALIKDDKGKTHQLMQGESIGEAKVRKIAKKGVRISLDGEYFDYDLASPDLVSLHPAGRRR